MWVCDIVEKVGVKEEVGYVILYVEEGWMINLLFDDFLVEILFLVYVYNGVFLMFEYGFLLWGVFLYLYFWKSVKWLCGI